jgi:hypothetical protein
MHSGDNNWHKRRVFSLIYNAGLDVEAVAKDAYYEFMIENALSPFSFPSLLKMENEILSMISSIPAFAFRCKISLLNLCRQKMMQVIYSYIVIYMTYK